MGGRGEIHRHSGWLVPLGLLGVIAALCGFLLLYYLRPPPAPFRNAQPTASTATVAIVLRGQKFNIPANYFESRAARGRNQLLLFAALPDMRGYSKAEDALFVANRPDSPVIHLAVREIGPGMDAPARLSRVYGPYLLDPSGEAVPFGLTRYVFRPDSAYARRDLFAGKNGSLLFLCERPAQEIPSPNCLAVDRPLAPGVALSYRFKRAHLARWQAIESGVNRLITGLRR